MRYAATTPVGDRLRVTLKKPEGEDAAAAKKDPWNYWVFEIGVQRQPQRRGINERALRFADSFDANRTTDAWRMSFDTSANYRDPSSLFVTRRTGRRRRS